MKQMRLTPSRRDFLRLTTYNDVVIDKDINKFVRYYIKGQLQKRQSLQNFNLFVTNGYLKQIESSDPQFLKFRATNKTFDLFKDF